MSYEVKQGNIFGRLGTGIGKGLSEQVPKEIERHRLSSGLKELGEKSGSPQFKQLAEFYGIPGVSGNPELIKQGTEFLKNQATRDAYTRNATGTRQEKPQRNPAFNESKFAETSPEVTRNPIPSKHVQNEDELVGASQRGQPQIANKNPLREEVKTVAPRTPEEKIDAIARLAYKFPYDTYPELNAKADEEEARWRAQPEAARAEDQRLRETQDRLRSGFQNLLEKKLQKEGKETYGDISGEMQNNLIRGMERDLAEHPNASEDDVINTWTQRGLDLAKARKNLQAKANSSLFATPILTNRSNYRRSLEEYGDIYKKAGNSEEYYNDLQTFFGFSPLGSASLAYKPSKVIKDYISKFPKGNILSQKNSAMARKAAIEIEDKITSNDSILSIARNFLEKDPSFDINAFYNQISEDKDNLGLIPRQRRELGQSDQFLKSNWADVLVLPLL